MILVLRALGIGDLATAVPALRGLRRAHPDRPLVLAAPDWLAPLARLTGCVDRLVPVAGLEDRDGRGLARRLGSPPYWAVNLHGRGPESHRLLGRATGAPLRAFACPQAGHRDGPAWSADEHEVRRWCRLLDWYGVPSDPDDLDLPRPGSAGVPRGVTVLHPGAKEPARRWSAGRFAAVARELDRLGHRVVVTGSPAERDLAGGVAEAAGLPPGAAVTGLDLPALAALIAHARLLVSADTGVAHLATAYRTPSVVLFGPVRPDHWGPPAGRPWHRVLWAGPADRAGTAERLHPALAAICPDEVLAAVADVDRRTRPDPAMAGRD
ncbi:glycosyltransferase family 9 protein [Plantactinospora sp. KBS50]|uniref:glycosyltransferase family 9 protein n=1 Tax=Plantactinospora sp. KBS50 TaxID=2024580 RepID=UPI000BAAFA20|nr:glycosyltransferase family 9 protein [Plantactinospora sp. KBS50]ASW54579.1 glycosyl transferase [Plantactinospora sp. KBS50]